MSSALPLQLPGRIVPPYTNTDGTLMRADGHQHARQGLVATSERDERVEALGVHDGLDRVGDDLAADQRRVHAFVAHRDAVAHRDGRELDREAAGGSRTPTFARLASRPSGMLHGVTSFHDEHTATCGLSQSSSVMPTARSMARAGARS